MTGKVRPKKALGQHFLTDRGIARKIVDALPLADRPVLEIGPGTGVLTSLLVTRPAPLHLIEIDRESVAFLRAAYPQLNDQLREGDFLEDGLGPLAGAECDIIGNFPYNISSQLFFRILEHRQEVKTVVCMLQKEVAQRIASPPGSKVYGILSVLLQTWYRIEYLFNVPPGVFHPPPKVMSGVIRLTRNDRQTLECDEVFFQKVVKQAFQTRRKTLRNALKNLNLPDFSLEDPLGSLRAEQLSVEDFIRLTRLLER
ncbi:MAG: 16S rRNA (adenine(1518)-N(6)/adenine(1519)-N(6))-dimethyltransferase RsmA [Cyclobacteriaceae bacterium]|nr:16S rRNA (adenine(1518)-N(6)/adenine(1519)-N(6))-dimethyltransferase RsmA [Cyclobacteriaceae bacterium]